MAVELRKTRLGEIVTIRYRDTSGRQIRETLGLKSEGWTKAKARAEERKRIVNVRTRKPATDFQTVADQWFTETGRLRHWKPRTKSAYERSIERLQFFHNKRVDTVRPKHVAQFIEQHDYAGKTTNFDVSVLYAVFEYALTHEMVDSNPAKNAPRPKNGKKKWRILTPEEIQAVDKAFDDVEFETERDRVKARLIFRVLTRTGLRRHELRQLRVRDFDPSRKILRVVDSKTEEGVRSIALPASLSKQLEEWIRDL